jgi:hypothetical protein
MKCIRFVFSILFFLLSCQFGYVLSMRATQRATAKRCIRSGCSNELCVEEGRDMITACEITPEIQCIQLARCTLLPSNQCGFIETLESQRCRSSLSKDIHKLSEN